MKNLVIQIDPGIRSGEPCFMALGFQLKAFSIIWEQVKRWKRI